MGSSLALSVNGFCAIILCFLSIGLSQQNSDTCNWFGSGSKVGDEVRSLYFKCSQGTIAWRRPKGAIRAHLKIGSGDKEFKGCLKVSGPIGNVQVFLESSKQLIPLINKSNSKKIHCFGSTNGAAALYIEAGPMEGAGPTLNLQYDLQPLRAGSNAMDRWEDCRPCSPDETLLAFCSSDFVAAGAISSISQNEDEERTEFIVRSKRVYRQVSQVFTKRRRRSTEDGALRSEYDNDVSYGTLSVPLSCGASDGGGEFMFMGRMKLGEARVVCAPRVEEWAALVETAKIDGSAQCNVDL